MRSNLPLASTVCVIAVAALVAPCAWAGLGAPSSTAPGASAHNTAALSPVSSQLDYEKLVTDGDVVFYLTVLHNNDGESQLIDLGGDVADFGGVARFKTLADLLKAEAVEDPGDGINRGVVLISSGDNFLAGPEFNASLDKGVPFYDTIALDLIGYQASAIGNHEFDFGPDVLADFITGFSGPIKFVTANLDFTDEPNLKVLVDDGTIVTRTILTVAGEQVGIVGATTPNLTFISSPRDVIVNPDVAGTVQAQIDALELAGVDKIILTSHLQSLQEDLALMPLLSGVDIAIAGGGDELLASDDAVLIPGDEKVGPYPTMATDFDGTPVPVVTTKGGYAYIGRLIVGFDAAGEIVMIDEASDPVRVAGGENPDAVEPDPVVQAQVTDPVIAAVEELALNVIAVSEVPLDGRKPYVRTQETNEGGLCADSLLWQASMLAPAFGAPLPDVAIQNGGGIRNNSIIPPGDFTELDTWDILPFPNFVTIIPAIPPAQFKEVMENAVSAVEFASGRFAQISGFRFTWDPEGTPQELDEDGEVVTPGTRVVEIVLTDGTFIVRDGEVAPGAPDINVATIDFLARGGDQYPYRGAEFVTLGVTYQQALRNYIEDYLAGVISEQDYPEGGEARIIELPPTDLPHGVACGDTTQSSTVLWAKRSRPGELTFQYSTDPVYGSIDGEISVEVVDPMVPAKVRIDGLTPDTDYFYRVIYNEWGNFVCGKFHTSAPAGEQVGLRFGATGDWQQAPPYPSLKNVPDRELELFVKLGDTIYADTETPALPGIVQARTLSQFRTKHAEVASPRPEAPDFNVMPDLTRSTSLLVTIDDHEVVDNFAGGALPGESPDAFDVHPGEPPLFYEDVPYVNQTKAYTQAMQALREYHPMVAVDWATPADERMDGRPKLYRYNTYGDDAAIIMLDSRSFRDAQLDPVADPTDPAAIAAFLAASYTPGRTLLGEAQLVALKADLLAAQTAGITWKFVTIPEPIQNFGPLNAEDRFEGYAVERAELLKFIDDNDIKNVVFMAGDFHGTLVNNLVYQEDPTQPLKAIGAIEIVTGPAAFYSGLFGPAVVNIAYAAGLIDDTAKALYDSLPVAPDPEDEVGIPNDKDDFLEDLLDSQLIALGLDPMGLDQNLPAADGLFDATLLAGDYVAAHVFSWAEFEIDADTQDLTVTLWGVDAHSEDDFLADPEGIVALEPEMISQFELKPQF